MGWQVLTRQRVAFVVLVVLLVSVVMVNRAAASGESVHSVTHSKPRSGAGLEALLRVQTPAPLVVVPAPVPVTDGLGSCIVPPVTGPVSQGFSGWHSGIDFAQWADPTAPILACRTGTVIRAGWDGGYGLEVVVDHGEGMETMYAHQSKILVTVGDRVEAGQQLGIVGSTGASTGVHLHFEVHLNGRPVDPAGYLSGP